MFLKGNADKACCIFYQLHAEVRSAFATLKVVPPNKVSNLQKISIGRSGQNILIILKKEVLNQI